MLEQPSRNLGLDLVRATEAAALVAGRWVGLGRPVEADQVSTRAMVEALDIIGIHHPDIRTDGESMGQHIELFRDQTEASEMDVLADPIDGRALLARGYPGVISVVGAAAAGAFQRLSPAVYMEKMVVNAQVAQALVPECLHAPAAWTLALVARALDREIGNLTVFMLDRSRHADLIREVRAAGAHVMLRADGDVTGALLAATRGSGVDVLMGVGGVTEGLLSACAVKALGGAMLARLAPQSERELNAIRDASLDMTRIMADADLVAGDCVFFAATGITDGPLLSGVHYRGRRATSNSMILRGETRTRRVIEAEHLLTR